MRKNVDGSPFRSPGLDLFRFLAALVVFAGHAVYFSSYGGGSLQSSQSFDIIRNGTFAVDFFFALSGYVLAGEFPNKRWFIARYIRLFPVYLLGVLIGSAVLLLLNNSLGISILGALMTILGLQAFFRDFASTINGPLWSLSVELILTPLFLIFWKLRKSKPMLLLLLISAVLLSQCFADSILLFAIPFFTLGAVLKYFNSGRKILPSRNANLAILLLSVAYFISGATAIRTLNYSISGITIKLLILGILIQCLVRMKMNSKISLFCVEVGKRSYVLYAIHGPLVGFFLASLKPSSLVGFFIYFLLLVCSVALMTELVYRKIEIPAIAVARRLRH